MQVEILQLVDGARRARGVAVAIDVLRACTTACYAIAAGARAVVAVAELDDALAFRSDPRAVLIGERGGRPLPALDLGNSPTAIADMNLDGRLVVLTTSAGTQGMVAAGAAGTDALAAACFVNAGATVRWLRARDPEWVSLLALGENGRVPAAEDDGCAAYIEARLTGAEPDPAPIFGAIRRSPSVARFTDPEQPWCPSSDLDLALEVDRFDFALVAGADTRGHPTLVPVVP